MRGKLKITGRHIDHDALTVWMFLLKEGGYWQARELGAMLAADYLAVSARSVCDRLVAASMVRSRQLPGFHPKFGVTAACKAPPGYGWMLEAAVHGTHPIDWAALEREQEHA